jgi:hypothetical protein
MSLVSTVANYGGKQPTNTQNIKQFVVGANNAVVWIYKRLANGQTVQTPADSKRAVYINNDLYVTGSIFNPSDQILKENIEIINNESNKLFDLNSVKYVFKSDKDKKPHYGFIAQEIEKIYPELVNNNGLGYKSVNYIEIIPLLLSKMKDMQSEIDELKTQIETIKLNTQ